jgi:hypothetical protein
MKNFNTCRAFLVLSFILIFTGLHAQDYVITVKGDSISGVVKPMFSGSTSKVQITDSNKKKTSYTLFQVKSFTFKEEIYNSVKGPNGYCFMLLKKAGYLSLYSFQLPNQNTFDGLYLNKRDGTGMEVPNLGFKKAMAKFLQECPSVADKIERGEELGKRNLDTIIDEFNACINNNTTYQSKLIVESQDKTKKISAWDSLENKLKSSADFDGKANAQEMITDIKGKISRGEKVPNFIIEGLKSIINPTELKVDLENALKELN